LFTSPASGKAYIYALIGALVQITDYTAGETTVPLAKGVYVVKTEGRTWKVKL
jgi:hypothetical protein